MDYIDYKEHKISNLILGSVQFGLDYGISKDGKPKESEINEILDFSHANGINCIDTALAYGDSEKSLSGFISTNKDVLIITKISSSNFKKNAFKNLQLSFDNLGLESICALLLHDSKLLYGWNDYYNKIINDLKKEKKIAYFGITIYDEDEFSLAIKNDNIDFIQLPFNIFDLRAIKFDYFKRAKKYNKLLFVRSIFLQGLLLMDNDKVSKNLIEATSFLEKFSLFAHSMKMSKIELALSFVYYFAQEHIIIFGCNNLAQAKNNIQAFSSIKKIEEKDMKNIISSFENINSNIYDTRKWLNIG